MKVMDKRILVSMPQQMFDQIQHIAESKYVSVAAYIRQALSEQLEEVADIRAYDKAKKQKSDPVRFV
jgi:Arc/MetJ-type ribon-helix-helix transcriptional regulator